MKALVYEGRVLEVTVDEFPVHPSMTWVEATPDIKPEYTYDGASFTPPPEPPAPPAEPAVSADEMLEALWDKAKGNNAKFDAAELKRNP